MASIKGVSRLRPLLRGSGTITGRYAYNQFFLSEDVIKETPGHGSSLNAINISNKEPYNLRTTPHPPKWLQAKWRAEKENQRRTRPVPAPEADWGRV